MTLRLNPTDPLIATPRTAPLQGPVPGQVDPAAKPADQDTARLIAMGGIEVARNVDIENLVVDAPPAPAQDAAKKGDPENLAGDLLWAAGSKFDNRTFKKGSSLANAPQILIHSADVARRMIANPGQALKRLSNLTDKPMDTINELQAAKGQFETVADAGGVLLDAGKRTVKNIRTEGGIVKGIAATTRDVADGVKHTVTDMKSHLDASTGSGLKNIPKEVTKVTALRTEKVAGQAIMKELTALPELAPTSLIGRARATITRAIDRPLGVYNNLIDRAGQAVEKQYGRIAETAGQSRAGNWVKNTYEAMNPAARVSKETLDAAKAAGHAKGVTQATEGVVKNLTKAGHKVAVDEAGRITSIVTKEGVHVSEAAVKGAVKAGGEAAAKEAERIAAKAAGRGLGRFAPGVNIAIAAYDTYHAAKVWRDPKSTGWQKGCATVTAAGSWLAATNIPIVSQAGAVVSLVSGVAENFTPHQIAHAAKAAVHAVGSGVKAVGGAIADGASAVYNKLKFW